MNRFLHGVARAVAETFDLPGPILEIGSYQVAGQEAIADLRSLFPGKDYLGVDMRPGPGVDLVADVEELPHADGSVGTVIAMSTFEHVPRFWRGFDEVHRVLRPDGALAGRLPVLLPHPQLPQRLLALHAGGAGSAAGGLPAASSLGWHGPGHAAGQRLGAGLPRGPAADHAANSSSSYRAPARPLRPAAAAAGAAAALPPGPAAVRPPAVRSLSRPGTLGDAMSNRRAADADQHVAPESPASRRPGAHAPPLAAPGGRQSCADRPSTCRSASPTGTAATCCARCLESLQRPAAGRSPGGHRRRQRLRPTAPPTWWRDEFPEVVLIRNADQPSASPGPTTRRPRRRAAATCSSSTTTPWCRRARCAGCSITPRRIPRSA